MLKKSTVHYQSLYVHFPFCENKCHYCDFYSLGREKTMPEDPIQFESALNLEAKLIASQILTRDSADSHANSKSIFEASKLDTIFFGGGTPTMTHIDSMKRALAPLNLQANDKIEWTTEANPSSLLTSHNNGTLRQFKDLGVNRISMGVQATQDSFLKLLGRTHNRNEVEAAIVAIHETGFTNLSCDLLCGVPGQSISDIEESLNWLTQFGLKHLSCYLLTLTKNNHLYKDLPDEETQLAHLLFVNQWMTSKGFEHYEISNYAKPTFEARHNLHYWKGSSYLGLGPSAHSFDSLQKRRFKNISSLHRYSDSLKAGILPVDFEEALTPDQIELEKWMLGLRLAEGFPNTWLDSKALQLKAETLISENLLQPHPTKADFLRPTSRGFALSDQLIRYFV